MRGEARIHVALPTEALYAMVSDVTRMGEWSPETVRCEWLDGATGPQVGARFKGTNKVGFFRWSTKPKVTDVEPGKVFAFETAETKWRYEFLPQGEGTELVESFETTEIPVWFRGFFKATNRERAMVKGMEKTLVRLKAAAEPQGDTPARS